MKPTDQITTEILVKAAGFHLRTDELSQTEFCKKALNKNDTFYLRPSLLGGFYWGVEFKYKETEKSREVIRTFEPYDETNIVTLAEVNSIYSILANKPLFDFGKTIIGNTFLFCGTILDKPKPHHEFTCKDGKLPHTVTVSRTVLENHPNPDMHGLVASWEINIKEHYANQMTARAAFESLLEDIEAEKTIKS